VGFFCVCILVEHCEKHELGWRIMCMTICYPAMMAAKLQLRGGVILGMCSHRRPWYQVSPKDYKRTVWRFMFSTVEAAHLRHPKLQLTRWNGWQHNTNIHKNNDFFLSFCVLPVPRRKCVCDRFLNSPPFR